MGLTQHRNAVATIKEIANLAFAQGNIGKPGAGLLPVRGHSNVQGDRTMGIWERPPQHFLDALQAEFGFDPPREHGLRHGRLDPRPAGRQGPRLPRSRRQLRPGGPGHRRDRRRAAPGPADGARLDQDQPLAPGLRRDRADPAHPGPDREGRPGQRRSSSSRWRTRPARCTPRAGRWSRRARSCGPRSPSSPASPRRRSATGTASTGGRCGTTTGVIRTHISRVVPGCEILRGERSTGPAVSCCRIRHGTAGPSRPRRGGPSSPPPRSSCCRCPTGQLVLQTLRSHDQFNTTIYGLSDRYRGIEGGRRVVFVHRRRHRPHLGLRERRAGRPDHPLGRRRRAAPGRTASGSSPTTLPAAARPRTTRRPTRWCRWTPPPRAATRPTSKSVIISLVPAGSAAPTTASETDVTKSDAMDATGADDGHKSHPEPVHLS